MKKTKVNKNKKWAVAALTMSGEKEENLDLIEKDLKNFSKGVEVFIPIHWNRDQQFQRRIHLVEGYIFVTSPSSNINEYFNLERSKYISSIVSYDSTTGRVPSLISDQEVQSLKNKLEAMLQRDFKEEDVVDILDGDYKNLQGKVLAVLDTREVSIQILGIKSADVIVRIQKVFLEKKTDS